MRKTLCCTVLFVSSIFSFAQNPFGKLKDLNIKKIPDAGNVLKGKEPITTSLEDAKTEAPELDDFEPKVILPGDQLPRAIDGSFYIFPGVWEFHLKSYCMKAGTYGPAKINGDGYSYAPLEGPKADIIKGLLMNGIKHPEVTQRDIQVLIWAIIARANFDDMPKEYLITASKLLDAKQMMELNKGIVNKVAQKELDKLMSKAPAPVKRILEAESKMRNMLGSAQSKYDDLEKVAVLAGVVPDEGGRDVKLGRWSLTPQGFYIRYFPSGYSYMKLQIYVKDDGYFGAGQKQFQITNSKSGGQFSEINIPYRKLKEFNPADHPAIPKPPRQRLGSSNQKQNPSDRNDALDKANRILKGADNAQNGLGLATDPLGTIVDKVNPFSPGNMFSHILDFITENGRKISDALNGDPPDPNYKEFAKAVPYDYKSLKQTPFKNPALSKSGNEFIEAYLDAHSLMKALVSSNDKQGGAKLANDDFWTNKQAQAIIYYKKKVGDALLIACDKWDKFLTALQAQAKGNLDLKQSNMQAYQTKLSANGFSKEEMDAFKFLQMTDEEISQMKADRLSYTPSQYGGNFIDESRTVLEAWKTFGETYAAFPEIPEPWE